MRLGERERNVWQGLAIKVIWQAYKDQDYEWFGTEDYDIWATMAFGRTDFSSFSEMAEELKKKKKELEDKYRPTLSQLEVFRRRGNPL